MLQPHPFVSPPQPQESHRKICVIFASWRFHQSKSISSVGARKSRSRPYVREQSPCILPRNIYPFKEIHNTMEVVVPRDETSTDTLTTDTDFFRSHSICTPPNQAALHRLRLPQSHSESQREREWRCIPKSTNNASCAAAPAEPALSKQPSCKSARASILHGRAHGAGHLTRSRIPRSAAHCKCTQRSGRKAPTCRLRGPFPFH